MERRQMLAGLTAAAAFINAEGRAERLPNTYLELKTWRLHNTPEGQASRVAAYLEHGLAPALQRAGARLDGAFGSLIAPDTPFYVTLTEYASLGAMEETLKKLKADEDHQRELQKLSEGSGLPFVRVESSLLRSFDGMPAPVLSKPGEKHRIFELRTYESQTFTTLSRKVGMFNGGEMQIFQRLAMGPVFFGETIIGPQQPNLKYMLSYDDLAARDRLWQAFGSDPEWNQLKARPGLSDPEIVANISNVILRSLPFSLIR
jgi:hypothetical protein